MYKLLIVDDEQIEREALRLVVERFLPEVRIVGEAENGRIAVEMARQLHPDVITMDIKMPGMDGVEAVRSIASEQSDIRIIMVSAFNTFEYARQVMRDGVKDYLLKPWKKNHILDSIRRVLKEIQVSKAEKIHKEALESKFRLALPAIEAEWVSAIIMDDIQESPLAEWSNILDIPSGACYSIVFTFSYPEGEASHQEKQQMYNWIKQKCKEKERCLVGPMNGNQIPAFVVPDCTGEGGSQAAKTKAVQFAAQIVNEFILQFNSVRVFAGIGTNSSTFEGLADSYREALSASTYTEAPARMIYYGDAKARADDLNAFPVDIEKRLLSSIKRGIADDALQLFDNYFEAAVRFANSNMGQVQHDLRKLFYVIKSRLQESGISLPDTNFPPCSLGETHIREHARRQLKQVLEQVRVWHMSDTTALLQKLEQFISDHYSKDLVMEEVAEHVGLSPYYFSKLLKDQYGLTYIDYLTKLRIEKAKEMIPDPSRSLKDICLSVGYRDPNYFSRVFKKTVGMSPSEFRLHHTGVEYEATNI